MLTRRRFVGYTALSSAMLASRGPLFDAWGQAAQRPPRLAILGSVYRPQSEMQMLADRFLVGYPDQGEWRLPKVQVVSMYVDQRARKAAAAPSGYDLAMKGTKLAPSGPGRGAAAQAHGEPHDQEKEKAAEKLDAASDLGKARAEQFGFLLCDNIPQALRCGGDRIAVDAVLTIVEEDDYPSNDKGQILLPNYDFFEQCVQVFEDEGHGVPYFNHKQLAFSFGQAQTIVETAKRLRFPLLAGSSLPVTWRLPDVDVPLGAEVQEAVMVGVGGLDGMDFDALEAMQCMVERRKGGETGVKAVQLLEGDDVWAAGKAGRWSPELLSSALSRTDTPQGLTVLDGRTQDLAASGVLPQLVKNPAAYCIEYSDGTRATLLMLDGAIADFNIAVKVAGHEVVSTQFFLPPAPNKSDSACLAAQIEQFFETQRTPHPVERTLLTSGVLEACLKSRHSLNQRLETPQLAVRYQPPTESQYARS
ncbi:MAG: hypothetical protein WA510_03170 [Acidobacteriaceae bacterium]